jgi:predicted 3-demethylubiquinone-9 3-methyltransferase (glyoxalase superfamily)
MKEAPMATLGKITPCLWFDTQAEEAAHFYTSVFKNSRIVQVTHYGSAGPRPEGMVMVVTFELEGMEFIALNGGPEFTFDEAISFQVNCESQEEVDEFWTRLGEGGQEGPCGWLKDKYGVSWQITPTILMDLVTDPDQDKGQRVMKAMLGMGKIDIAELQRAADQA